MRFLVPLVLRPAISELRRTDHNRRYKLLARALIAGGFAVARDGDSAMIETAHARLAVDLLDGRLFVLKGDRRIYSRTIANWTAPRSEQSDEQAIRALVHSLRMNAVKRRAEDEAKRRSQAAAALKPEGRGEPDATSSPDVTVGHEARAPSLRLPPHPPPSPTGESASGGRLANTGEHLNPNTET